MQDYINRYKDLLLSENQKHNLVSRKSLGFELNKHLKDSIQILEYISLKEGRLVDMGSGAGFPGLILAIYCPALDVVLVEADLKKSDFLKQVVEKLELANVKILRTRLEELGRDPAYREQFDYCSCRALAQINVALEYGMPLLRVGGKMLLWKGRNYASELDVAQKALSLLSGRVGDCFEYSLMGEMDRALVFVEKEAPTISRYHRRVGIPAKRPL